jgi:hypothetical protein
MHDESTDDDGTETGDDRRHTPPVGESDEMLIPFDVEELNIEWSKWLPGMDYTAVVRSAQVGEAALQRLMARLKHTGTRARTLSMSTLTGEPVVRADMHPDGWREVEALAADGERYRRLIRASRF